MSLATLIVAAAGSLFTAVAAAAAWRAASVSATEAHRRTEPYVAMGVPRQDYDNDALTVPLKNLGLGPARVVALQAKDLRGLVISARVDPGLAPMEQTQHVLSAMNWLKLDPPTWEEVSLEGLCEDSNGKQHPIFAFGGQPLPFPSSDAEIGDLDHAVASATRASRAFELKRVGRAARDGDLVATAYAWRDFWRRSERQGELGEEYVKWVREEWKRYELSEELFFEPDTVENLILRLEN